MELIFSTGFVLLWSIWGIVFNISRSLLLEEIREYGRELETMRSQSDYFKSLHSVGSTPEDKSDDMYRVSRDLSRYL